jgi:3-dehydroquinate synthase
MKRIRVNSERQYEVTFPEDWHSQLEKVIANRNFVVLAPERLASQVLEAFSKAQIVVTEDGETQKSLTSYSKVMEKIAGLGLDRSSVIVGIGGGATTDLAGFVAATYMRGIDWLAVPTTVAGMVDAAIGGKTGINLASGKNLAGAFHSPIEVIIDTNWLKSLSQRDIRAGLAEAVKCGFIANPKILELIVNWSNNLQEIIELSVEVKAGVVSRDFKESLEREILNYGHTLGHAIEKHSNYSLRHGEAVSIGLCFAAALSSEKSGLDAGVVSQHEDLLQRLDLPTSYAPTAFAELYELMQSDKKRRAAEIRFVTLTELGKTDRTVASREELERIYKKTIGR